VDALADSWENGDATAIEEHASIVLEASEHDEIVPKQWDIQYEPESKTILMDYALPTPDDIPSTKTVRYVASTGELKETQISARDKKALFDDLCFQLCLRTIHELFEATPMIIWRISFSTAQRIPSIARPDSRFIPQSSH